MLRQKNENLSIIFFINNIVIITYTKGRIGFKSIETRTIATVN